MSLAIMHPVHDQGVVWRNGQLMPFADATTHVLSHMSARGSQIFDVLLVTRTDVGPCAVGLRAHVTRFLRSAEMMGMIETGEVAELEHAVAQTVIANSSPVSKNADRTGPVVVKLIAGWAEEGVGLLPAELRPTVYVLALPHVGEHEVDSLGPPAKVKTASMPKIPSEILPPSMKVAAGYTPGVREVLAAKAEGYDQVVFRTMDGDLAESTTLSMVVLSDGKIAVPPLDSVLDGITRRLILDAAQHLGIPTEVRVIGWEEVLEADELMLTSTNNPVQPVELLDEIPFEAPGPMTSAIAACVTDTLRGHHELSEVWLTPLDGLVG